jgi:sialate O-acetylesterase
MRSLSRIFWLLGLLVCSANLALAIPAPFVHQLFSSNMVLQRDVQDPIWGWTTPGASVTVTINSQSKTAVADANGRWQANIGPFTAGGPYVLTVSGPQTATFTNVMFGDVFLCSGQSNMEYAVNGVYNSSAEIADSANYPNIRCFTVPKVSALTPQDNLSSGSWLVAGNSTTAGFSAVAYFMAREIYKKQNIPIGIVASAWGGTQIQSWVDAATAGGVADFGQDLYDQAASGIANADTITGHYNGLIHPMAPFRFKAAIWYQGESNAGRGQQYSRLLPGMLSVWRSLFGVNLPFIIVQLASTDAAQSQPVETGGWAEIREAQSNAVRADLGRSRLVNTIDIGEGNLHPLDKQDVGLRASWAAANLLYGQNVISEGPVFSGATVVGNAVRCTFTNVGGGLMVGTKNPQTPLSPAQQVSGGTLQGFAIAGADHVFYAANATITSTTTVSVSSASVSAPLYVRYAWANFPNGNLYNKIVDAGGNLVDGLPASSFRNDPIYKLNVNAAFGGTERYTTGDTTQVTAATPAGQVFHHWSGDTAALSGSGSPATATLSQLYVSLRANFQITAAPSISVSARVGQNVVEWLPLDNVHYNVKRGTSSSGPFTTIAGNLVGTLRYVDTNVADGVAYYYTVSAVNEVGEGPAATAVAATGIAHVHGLQATPGAASVSLAWDAFGGGALSYNIGRSTVPGGPYQALASGITATSYVDRAVAPGAVYYYVVSASMASATTPVSQEVSAMPNFLPLPMKDLDVGSVALPGSVTMQPAGAFVMKASGADISGPIDAFHFAYTAVTGDCTLTARVPSLENTNTFAKGGVMLRATLDPSSTYAFAFFLGIQTNVGNQFRVTTGESNISTGGNGADRWVRVARVGNVFTTYSSPDGAAWTQMGIAQTIAMPATIYAGLALSSHDDTKLNTTTFDHVSGIAFQPIEAPQALVADVRATDGNVALHWNASPGAINYNVKVSASSGGPFTTVASGISTPRYEPTGLAPATRYFLVVTAVTAFGESANSSQVTVDVPALSGNPAPVGVSGSALNAQAKLTWSGSAIATGYTIKRATLSGGPYTVIQSSTVPEYLDAGLANGTTYYYVISASGPGGESANSAQIAVTPRYASQAGTMRALINGRYVSAAGSAPLIASQAVPGTTEFFELQDLGSGLTAIRSRDSGRYVSASNAGADVLAASATIIGPWEHFIFSPAAGGAVSFKAEVNGQIVTADGGGSLPLIAARTGVGLAETFSFDHVAALEAPGNLAAWPGNAQVTLGWASAAGATKYIVRRASSSGGPYSQIAETTATSYVDSSLVNGTSYYYVVAATNASAVGSASDEVGCVPQPPANGLLSREGWIFSASSAPSWNLPSAAGDGDPSTRWSTGVGQASGQWFQADMGTANVVWQIVLDATGSPGDFPRGYQVNLSNDGVNWGTPVASGMGASAVTTINFPAQSTRYIRVTQTGSDSGWWSIHEFLAYGAEISVQILNRSGWQASASSSGGSDPVSNALDGNNGTRWSTGAGQANGQWFQVDMGSVKTFQRVVLDASGSDGDYPRGYQVQVSNDGVNWGSPVATGAGSSAITTINFTPQTARYIRVTQTGSNSGWWSIHEFNVYGAAVGALVAPTGLGATGGNGQVALSWTASSGAAGYNVKRATVSGGPYTTVNLGTATSYTDTGLSNGAAYFYVVTATNSGGESGNSNQAGATPGAMPSPWQTVDIGSVGVAGSAFYVSPSYTLVGSGSDIWGTMDAFRYVYQVSSGDCSIVARVSSEQNTDPWAKAGVMIRETTGAGAINAALVVTPGGISFQWRSATGDQSVNVATGGAVPYWLKLTRTGNAVAAYSSSNGTTWTQVGATQTLTMASSATIGLAVTAHNNAVLCTSSFDSVTATP